MTLFPSKGPRIDAAALMLVNRDRMANGYDAVDSMEALQPEDASKYRLTVRDVLTAYYDHGQS